MRRHLIPFLAWLTVLSSATLTLASATTRPKTGAAQALPARSSPAGEKPECGPSCPRRASPAPGAPDPRDLWIRV